MIKRILRFFKDTVFRRDASEYRNPVVRWSVKQYKLLFYTARGLVEHRTWVRSAALTFYTLMSIVPIAAVVFAVVKGFGMADNLLDNLYSLFPQNPEIIDYLVDFADRALARTQGGVVAVVALITLFWAVIKVFGSIESAFNDIWEVKVTRSLARQYTDYITIVFIAPILWGIVHIVGTYLENLLGGSGSEPVLFLSRLSSLLVTWIMFTFLYTAIPNARVRFRSAFTAGMIAGTLFILFQWGYVYLQRWMTSYNAIYGSFAALPLFLIWMQASWQILLFGGELSFAYQNIGRFAEERESLLVSYDQRRKIMLAVMLVVVRRFHEGKGPAGDDEIRHALGLPTRIVNDVLFQLVTAGLLVAIPTDDSDREMAYTLASDPSSLTVYGVLEAADMQGRTFDLKSLPEMECIDREVERIKANVRASKDNLLLTDLL